MSLVSRAMAERPQERFSSARDMREALDAAMYTVEEPQPARMSFTPPPVPRMNRGWMGVAMTVACAVIVGSSSSKVGSDAAWLGPLADEALKRMARAEIAYAAPPPTPLPAPVVAAPAAVQPPAPAQESEVPPLPAAPRAAAVARASAPVKAGAAAPGSAKAPTPARVRPGVGPKTEEQPVSASLLVAASVRELEALREQLDVSAASGVSEPANPGYQVTD